MAKKKEKPTTPLSISSSKGATFNAIKLKGENISKKNVKGVQDAFKERYSKPLHYEILTLSQVGYLTL